MSDPAPIMSDITPAPARADNTSTEAPPAPASTTSKLTGSEAPATTSIPSSSAPETTSAAAPTPTAAAAAASIPPIPPPPASPSSPLARLTLDLPRLVQEAEHGEMWGVELHPSPTGGHVPTGIVLEKFLRANKHDVDRAGEQLLRALKWRKTMQPGRVLDTVEFEPARFGGLGYVTVYGQGEGRRVVTWNVYGEIRDKQATFGDTDAFLRWRAALMELSIRQLHLAEATVPIPEQGADPYKIIQVHDYQNVNFLRMDPNIRAASKRVIETFGLAYPELLEKKFFVNVPAIMGWVFSAVKLLLAPETVKKFHPLSYGRSLAGELPELREELPKDYGGQGKHIKEGMTVKYAESDGKTAAAA